MINLGGDVRCSGDPQQFIHRFQQLVAFTAHMRYVHAVILCRDFAQFDQFFGARVEGGGVDQR